MDLSKELSLFMAREGGGEREGECGGKKFHDLFSWRSEGGERIFFPCIISHDFFFGERAYYMY